MDLLEINPNVFAAPRERPPGMDPKVVYEPMLEMRNGAFDWIQKTAIKAYYDSGAAKVPHKVLDWLRRDELAPISGTPGSPLPDAPGAYRVAVIGDMGEGSPAQDRNTQQILRWNPTHVATVGDNVYPLGREKDWQKRFDSHYEQLRMHTTWQPSLGNHDYYAADLRPYFARFPQLGGRAYYSWSLGPAQFFVLDTEQRLDGSSAQQAWLAAELARSTAPYKVLQMHRPMVSSRAGSIGRNIYGSLGPLLARYGVQLVLAGHEHGYERSREINGTQFMTVGGGGAATYGYPGGMPDQTVVRTGRNHHLELSFDDSRMVVRAIDDRGQNFDTTVVLPRAATRDAAAGAALAAAA
jgi:acid phosphatase